MAWRPHSRSCSMADTLAERWTRATWRWVVNSKRSFWPLLESRRRGMAFEQVDRTWAAAVALVALDPLVMANMDSRMTTMLRSLMRTREGQQLGTQWAKLLSWTHQSLVFSLALEAWSTSRPCVACGWNSCLPDPLKLESNDLKLLLVVYDSVGCL